MQQQVVPRQKALAQDLKVVTEAVQHFLSVSTSAKELEKANSGNAGALFVSTVPSFPSAPRGRSKVAKKRTDRFLRDEDVLSQDGTLLEEINSVFDAFVLSQGAALPIGQSTDRYHGLENFDRASQRVWASLCSDRPKVSDGMCLNRELGRSMPFFVSILRRTARGLHVRSQIRRLRLEIEARAPQQRYRAMYVGCTGDQYTC